MISISPRVPSPNSTIILSICKTGLEEYTYSMRKDKEKAFELRKQGKSYNAIREELGISKSTLSDWFKNIEWSKHSKVSNTKTTRSPEHIERMHKARRDQLSALYREAEDQAENSYQVFKKEPLFWAGLMAYAGEGEKRSKHYIKITNSEFYIHTIFIKFSQVYLEVKKQEIRCGLIVYPDLNASLCKEMWSNMLGLSREQFHKTQVIQGKELKKRLQYGVAMSIISSTVLKKKIMKWISLAQDERFQEAGMVQG